jgi:phenylacetate-CoA ligase
MWQPELEALERESLERVVVERMRATLACVLKEPAWARRLAGVDPRDIVRIEDWRKLPFLTKDALRDAYPYGLAGGRAGGYVRIQMSSGTTGNPILNPYTAADVAQWGEVMARCYVAAGVRRDDVIQITPSFGLFTGGFGFHYGAERLGAMVIPTGAGRTTLQLRLMRDLGTTVVAAIATYPLRLIEAAKRFGKLGTGLRVLDGLRVHRHPPLRTNYAYSPSPSIHPTDQMRTGRAVRCARHGRPRGETVSSKASSRWAGARR